MEELAGIPILLFATQSDWELWLESHHEQPKGVWLKLAKKDSPLTTLSYSEALEEALCYGWIDGQKKAFDADAWLQKFTPRRPKSVWSKVNVEKVAQLLSSGLMKPSGIKEVNAAKEDGRWDAAYESQRNFTIPEDFQTELAKNDRARAFFESLNRQNQYSFCHRIQTAKKAETRQARIDKFIEMLNSNQKLYP
ncbi:YdeI/OmpD-associated family protein [Tumebacillus flagellatus]|uniref:Bacteriocin-protection protein n=1 Tax=Tumebacillus flagellatus TaxID=1157490 RepID=A0A074LNX2_9BACL|nr:YdeI/OmpD-associated family protein [Tumebacillus flagellatus]KEO82804.1 hypothetical protein EL26_13740 [Tumebacillus flagellatus]